MCSIGVHGSNKQTENTGVHILKELYLFSLTKHIYPLTTLVLTFRIHWSGWTLHPPLKSHHCVSRAAAQVVFVRGTDPARQAACLTL